ncbi:hypothetical protein BZG36_04955 [Bifiguratus adelaidae]|uniref:Uncharacterized protein n=1 Tax=Bifiguratus adelaidae TaxID=1938954 RepID=A0A261XUQ1_9FUNG|nr:hypothetical protein BZG36_04955 [Bifiguratus adelaidae]
MESQDELTATVQGLKAQIRELQQLVQFNDEGEAPASHATTDGTQVKALREQIAQLQRDNAKLQYRILHLLRALDARDRSSHS